MKKYMKYFIMSILLLLLSASTFANSDMIVKIGDNKINFERQNNGEPVGYPYVENNRTYVPIRVISEDLGYNVKWEQESLTAVIKKGETTVRIKIGENTALVNGVRKNIDVSDQGVVADTKAISKNNRTYVPVRFITETMGEKVDYRLPSTSNVKAITVYINPTNLPVVRPVKPDIPSGAELVGQDQYSAEYNYIVDLPSGGQIRELSVAIPGSNAKGSISGVTKTGGIFTAIYRNDGTLTFHFSDISINTFDESDYTVMRDEFNKFKR